jgi:hypothetical protein
MKISRLTGVTTILLAASIMLTGCSTPTPVATQTIDPQIIAGTVSAAETEAVQTVYHQLTESAALTPTVTNTPLPTNTLPPTETPAVTVTPLVIVTATSTALPPTATIVYVPTSTATLKPRSQAYQCSVVSRKPADGAQMTPGSDFDFKVTLKNTGKNTWKTGTVDFEYMNGDEFQKRDDFVDLPNDVAPGESVSLIVDMTTKNMTGIKSTVWGLYNGEEDFCDVSLSLLIK